MHQKGANQLLAHLEQYGIIVCKSCQFAIQPSALQSHLLRHRIYRNERRQLLQELAKLDLLEPEQAPLPLEVPVPLPYLTVHGGNVKARPAYLQTFFRGNKIRYFEVNGPGNSSAQITGSSGSHAEKDILSSLSPLSANEPKTPISSTDSKTVEESTSAPVEPNLHQPPLDMLALRYFHHYTVATSLTIARGAQETQSFWQTEIPHQALKHPFLMYGILGLSALHLAVQAVTSPSSSDPKSHCAHLQTALQYQNAALEDFRSAMHLPDSGNSTALIAFARFFGVQRCVQHQLEWKLGANYTSSTKQITDSNQISSISKLLEFFFLLRGGHEMMLTLQHLLPSGSDFTISAEGMDELREVGDHMKHVSAAQISHVPVDIVDRITALPGKLASLLLREENSYETELVANFDQVVNGLLSAFAVSYASEEVHHIWNAAEGWLRSVPDQFIHMLSAAQPGSLVIFAYWTMLVKRLEQHYWFCRGQASRLHSIVMQHLPDDDWRSLVVDMVS